MSEILTIEQKKARHYGVKHTAGMQVKDVDTVGRTVTGFYNTYNFLDSDKDVLLPGCSKKSIKERGPKSEAVAKIKHALFHDLTQLPGKIIVLEEKEIDGIMGLYFETKMATTTLGTDTLKNYNEGVYDNHSIGFRYEQLEYIDQEAKGWAKAVESLINPDDAAKSGYLFLVKEISLFEGSTVSFGANKLTPFLGVKSGNKDSMKLALFGKMEQLQKMLKKGTQTDGMMHTFELQISQIKQMIDELTDEMPLKDFTSSKKPKQEENQNSFANLINEFKLT